MPTRCKQYRQAAGYTAEEAASQANVSLRSLRRYEAGEIDPPADVVLQLAIIYHAPALLREFQSTRDPIGEKFGTPCLNGINKSLTAYNASMNGGADSEAS